MPVDKQIQVMQVLSPTSCLANLFWEQRMPEPGDPYKTEGRNELVCIQEFDTRGMTDHRIWDCDQKFEVVGTYSYQTIAGPKTILLLKPFKDK
jgi:hypothetical protein